MTWAPVMGITVLATLAAATTASAEGVIVADAGRAEVFSARMPAGTRIELAEGWLEVEEDGAEDQGVGSFTEEAPSSTAGSWVAGAAAAARSPANGSAGAVPEPARSSPSVAETCRQERVAYLRQLWKESGIDVDDPEALIDGLDAGTSGPAAGFGWFALQVDPFRNLAWSTELRGLARRLVRCVHEARATAR